MEKEQRVFLAYRAVFEGNNAQIRQPKVIKKLVSEHGRSAQTLLQSLGEKEVIDTLKTLLERKVFQSELEAKLAFPRLFTISSSQNQQHIASEADAARSEAEALDDIASQCGDEDDAQDEIIDEASSKLTTAEGVTAQMPGNNVTIPSLYPIYIPYKVQHLVLSRAQSMLEECCYDFTVRWLPELLEQRQWDCPEAIELNVWTHVVMKHLGKLPSQAFANKSALSWADGLTSVVNLRHSAVHRNRTTAKGISEMIRCATTFARVLRDSVREQQLDKLNHELHGKIQDLELNKNFLETRLEVELREIVRQRKELDEREKAAISTMLREDKDHSSLIGGLLSTSIKHILEESENKEQDVTEAERSSDQETEVEKEQEYAGCCDPAHQAERHLSIKDHPISTQITVCEKNETGPDCAPITVDGKCDQTITNQCTEIDETQHDRNHKHGTGCGLHSEPSSLEPQQLRTSELGPSGSSPTTKDGAIGSIIVSRMWESPAQNSDINTAAQEAEDLLNLTLHQEAYTKFAKVVDDKLSKYYFHTGGMTKLNDKRLQQIRAFVQEQTKLNTAIHQTELDSIIRFRFATFQSEQRLPTSPTSKMKKETNQSVNQTDVVGAVAWGSDADESPLET